MSRPRQEPATGLKSELKQYLKKKVQKAKDDNLLGQLSAFAVGDRVGMERAANKANRKAQEKTIEQFGAFRNVGEGPRAYFTGSNPITDGRTVEVGSGAFGGNIIIMDRGQDMQATLPGPAKVKGQAVKCYDITESNFVVVASNGGDDLPSLEEWITEHADVYIAKTSMADLLGEAMHYNAEMSEDKAAERMESLVKLYAKISGKQPSDEIADLILRFYQTGANPATFEAGSKARGKAFEALQAVKEAGPKEGLMSYFAGAYEMHLHTKAGMPDAASIYYQGGEESIGMTVESFEICYTQGDQYVVTDTRAAIIKHGIEMLAKPVGSVGAELTHTGELGSAIGDVLKFLVETQEEGGDEATKKLGKLIKVEFSRTGAVSRNWKSRGAYERRGLIKCTVDPIREVGGVKGPNGVGFLIGDVASTILGTVA